MQRYQNFASTLRQSLNNQLVRNHSKWLPEKGSWSLQELQGKPLAPHEEITTSKLQNLAELSHLHLDSSQLESMRGDVEKIIQCTHMLQSVALDSDVDEFYNQCTTDTSDKATRLRPDVEVDYDKLQTSDILKNAAKSSGSYFEVPKVLEEE